MFKRFPLIAATLFALVSSVNAQTYTNSFMWGLDRTADPYDVGINLSGSWYSFAKISSLGTLAFENKSFVAQDVSSAIHRWKAVGQLVGLPALVVDSTEDDKGGAVSAKGYGDLYFGNGTGQILVLEDDASGNVQTRTVHIKSAWAGYAEINSDLYGLRLKGNSDGVDINVGSSKIAHFTDTSATASAYYAFTPALLTLAANTSITLSGTAKVTTPRVRLTPTTIANLGTCDANAKGTLRYVSDTVGSAAPAFGGTVAGGGATAVERTVVCNGTNWVY